MSAATTTIPSEPEPPLDRNIVHRCCALKVSGDQCRQSALRGQNYCTTHVDRDPHVFATPGHIIIPLLDDPAAVQLTTTKILSALANGTMQPTLANAMNRTLNTAARTFPRPPRLKPGQSEPRQQPALFTVDDNGAWVAPPQPWLDDAGNPITYDQLAARLNLSQLQPDPATAVTNSYKQLIQDLLRQKIRREKAESAAARAAGLPDPHPTHGRLRSNGKCAFGIPFCDGPCDPEPCMLCRGDLHLQPNSPQYPGDNILALVVALRTHIKEQKESVHRAPVEERQKVSSTGDPEEEREEAPHIGDPEEERTFSPASAAPEEAGALAPENSIPEPAFTLDLKAVAHRSPARRTQNADRRRPTRHRLQATGSPHVVEFVNKPNHHIPNSQKHAQPRKHQISPQRAANNLRRSLPLLTLDQGRARYFANASSPAANH